MGLFEPFKSVLYHCWLKAFYCSSWMSISLRLLVVKDTTELSPEGWKWAKRRYHNLGFLPEFSSISWDNSVQIVINLWPVLWCCGMLRRSQLTIFPVLPRCLWRDTCVEASILSFWKSLPQEGLGFLNIWNRFRRNYPRFWYREQSREKPKCNSKVWILRN